MEHRDYLERQIEAFSKAMAAAVSRMLRSDHVWTMEAIQKELESSSSVQLDMHPSAFRNDARWTTSNLESLLELILSKEDGTHLAEKIEVIETILLILNEKSSTISMRRLKLIQDYYRLKEHHGIR